MKVEFYPLNEYENNLLFVVIQARYMEKWIFVRHRERTTWEIPGGHIECGEETDTAAARELSEETGAIDFRIKPVCNYSVEHNTIKTYGRMYYAEVGSLGELEHEIDEIMFDEILPDYLTYPQIQPYLFEKVKEYFNEKIDGKKL